MSLELVLTSGVISGIVGVIVKALSDNQTKKLELKLIKQNKKFEVKLSSLAERQRVDYNLLIDSLQSIWKQFAIIENYFLLDMVGSIKFDSQFRTVRLATHEIRNQMLFLPDSIHDIINDFLNKIFEQY